MANLTTSADIIDYVLFVAGEKTDSTSDFYEQTIIELNRAHLSILKGGQELEPTIQEQWKWLKTAEKALTLNPVEDTGTASVANNSTTVTLSATIATSMVGRFFKVDDHADVFPVTAHTAGTADITLGSVYTGSTNTAASFRLMQIDYDLTSDCLYPTVFSTYQDNGGELQGLDEQDFIRRFPLNTLSSGVPTHVSLLSESSSGSTLTNKVRFNRYGGTESGDLILVHYSYIKIPSDLADDTSEPLVPRIYRKVLADWTLAFILESMEDSRAGSRTTIAVRGLQAMAMDNRREAQFRSGENFGRISPRSNDLRRTDGPLRTESGSIIG